MSRRPPLPHLLHPSGLNAHRTFLVFMSRDSHVWKPAGQAQWQQGSGEMWVVAARALSKRSGRW